MNYLKELRSSKGVSQQIVAEYLGISRQAYSNYENGNREPDFETLLKLGEFFNCSVDYILRGANANSMETKQKIEELNHVYLSFAKEAQENKIDPEDIKLAIETIKRLREK